MCIERHGTDGARPVHLAEVVVEGRVVFVRGARAKTRVPPFLPLRRAKLRDERIGSCTVTMFCGPSFSARPS